MKFECHKLIKDRYRGEDPLNQFITYIKDQYGAHMLATAISALKSQEQAETVVFNALLHIANYIRIQEKVVLFDSEDRSKALSYLKMIVIGRVRLLRRGEQKIWDREIEFDESLHAETLSTEERVIITENVRCIYDYFDKNMDTPSNALYLYAEGLTYVEIADELGLSVNYVGVAIARARKQFAQWLAKEREAVE